ncbi:sodium/proline symporter [Candidatus Protochlamydia phocaeensis]|uniref:sodium/proline symporter n=1 Tax=Candidatus Protochlamydia phocaeensis TaxID=1414722 RepID=UPI0009AD28B3|nr:sodium/proline symporter [Candidatus Protochlamydia phocaeensis]
MNIYFISAFLGYFALLLLIGLIAHKKHTSSADFIMGNRSMSFWLVSLSAHASDMSAWLFMGLPMSVFLLGLSQAWIAIGLVIGMYLNWQWIAPRLRIQTELYGCYTLSSFFEKRLNDTSGRIRLISAIILIIFLTHYLSAGMIGIGTLLESLFGLNYYFGLILTLCVVVAYTFVGGFVAVAWTDLFQGLFLLLVIVCVPLLAFFKLEGIDQISQVALGKGIGFSLLPDNDPLAFLTMFLLAFSWGVGYFGMPHVITKFMSIKEVSELNKSKWLGIGWQIIVLSAAILVGVVAIAFFPNGLENPQMIFVEMVKGIFHPFIAGFILCAVLAASLSTMDSQILVCASVISEDLYAMFAKQEKASDKQLLISRLGVVLVSFVALGLALNKSATIMDTVSYSWAGLGSAFGPLVIVSLYSKRINRYGAMAGMLIGAVVAMGWSYLNSLIWEYTIPAMIPGFACNLISIYLISYLMPDSNAGKIKMPAGEESDQMAIEKII